MADNLMGRRGARVYGFTLVWRVMPRPLLIFQECRFGNLEHRSKGPVEPFHGRVPSRLSNRKLRLQPRMKLLRVAATVRKKSGCQTESGT